jgi:hypothetical protein
MLMMENGSHVLPFFFLEAPHKERERCLYLCAFQAHRARPYS